MIRLGFTLGEVPPSQEDWKTAPEYETRERALKELESARDLVMGLGLVVWFWLAHDGPDVPGLWKPWLSLPPSGAISSGLLVKYQCWDDLKAKRARLRTERKSAPRKSLNQKRKPVDSPYE